MSEKELATILREEAELAEKEVDSDTDVWVPTRRRAKDPSMVYSVRIPVARVEELRRVAAGAGMDPSAMVRQWVLERLDAEAAGRPADGDDALAHAMAALLAALVLLPEKWGLLLTPHADPLLRAFPAVPDEPSSLLASSSTKRNVDKALAKVSQASRGSSVKAAAPKKLVPAKAAAKKAVPAKASSKKAASNKAAGRKLRSE
jgi:hypothetical protein